MYVNQIIRGWINVIIVMCVCVCIETYIVKIPPWSWAQVRERSQCMLLWNIKGQLLCKIHNTSPTQNCGFCRAKVSIFSNFVCVFKLLGVSISCNENDPSYMTPPLNRPVTMMSANWKHPSVLASPTNLITPITFLQGPILAHKRLLIDTAIS